MNTSICRNPKCKRPIFFGTTAGEWLHGYKNVYGDWTVQGKYCHTPDGRYTATPLNVATPILHDEGAGVL